MGGRAGAKGADRISVYAILADIDQVRSPFHTILNYELALGIPAGWINYSLSKTAPNGFWHRLERGEIPLDQAFFQGFTQDLRDAARWEVFYRQQRSKRPEMPEAAPRLPEIDGEFLFNEMMTESSHLDPWMFPALQNLRSSGKYILAALSNTVAFPKGHKLFLGKASTDPLRSLFDVFVSSAHIGLRKPDPKVYRYALRQLDSFARSNASSATAHGLAWEEGILPHDVLFLDDIGENLREARKQGFGTIKVPLGRSYEAVEQLERVTGLNLAGDHLKRADESHKGGSKARI